MAESILDFAYKRMLTIAEWLSPQLWIFKDYWGLANWLYDIRLDILRVECACAPGAFYAPWCENFPPMILWSFSVRWYF